jgi:hypothetical protein
MYSNDHYSVYANNNSLLESCICYFVYRAVSVTVKEKAELCGLSPRANYTDRATAACRRS